MIFRKNLKLKCYIYFFLVIDLKKQSEHSGLYPDTSSFVFLVLDFIVKGKVIHFVSAKILERKRGRRRVLFRSLIFLD